MTNRNKCLILGLTVFLWVGVHAQSYIDTCRLLRKFNLTGYVEAENHSMIIGGLFPIHTRTIPINNSDTELEFESAMCEG